MPWKDGLHRQRLPWKITKNGRNRSCPAIVSSWAAYLRNQLRHPGALRRSPPSQACKAASRGTKTSGRMYTHQVTPSPIAVDLFVSLHTRVAIIWCLSDLQIAAVRMRNAPYPVPTCQYPCPACQLIAQGRQNTHPREQYPIYPYTASHASETGKRYCRYSIWRKMPQRR